MPAARSLHRTLGLSALLAAATACDPGPPPQPPLPADARAAVDAVLAQTQGPVRGTLDHVLLELRSSADGPLLATVALSAARIRIDHADGSTDIAGGGSAWRCRRGEAPQRLAGEATADVERWRDLLAAALLVPLQAPKAATWRGPDVIALEAADGSTHRLEVDRATHLPRRLSGPAGEVRFLGFLRTPVSNLPQHVELGALGPRWLRVLATDVLFEDFVFHDPDARPAPGSARSRALATTAREARPLQPQVESIAPTLFLVLPDPDTWEGRARSIASAGEALAAQGQIGQGLPYLFQDGGTPALGVPFEPDDETGSRPFTAQPGQDVRRRPRHLAAVVYRGKGLWSDAVREAPAALAAFVQTNGLRTDGPLRVIPYLAWEEGTPDEARLAHLAVRFEQPLVDDANARARAGGR